MRRTMRFSRRRPFSRRSYSRPYRSSLRRRFSRPSRIRNLNPITADTFAVKLKFNDVQAIQGGASSTNSYKWRGNSVYDPDLTGTGTQPMGYDQYSTLYDYVAVMGSQIKIRLLSGSDQVQQFCVYPQDSTVVTPVTSALREIPYGKTGTNGPYTSSSGNKWLTLKNYMSTAKLYCVDKSFVRSDSVYAHSTATNPTNSWYWILTVDTPAVPSNNNYYFDVQITYYCLFKRRTQLGES